MPVAIIMFVLALVGLIVIVCVWLVRSRGARWRPRPTKRHVVTRIVCGAGGVGILGAVAVTSYLDVRRPDAPPDVPQTVRVPTKTLSEIHADLAGGQTRRLTRARLLVRMMVLDVSAPLLRPIVVDEHEFQWAGGQNERLRRRKEIGDDIVVSYDVNINRVSVVADHRGGRRGPELRLSATSMGAAIQYRHGSAHSGFSGLGRDDDRDGVIHTESAFAFRDFSPRNPLSLVPGPIDQPSLYLSLSIELLADDDPMKTVPLASYIDARSRDVWLHVWRFGNRRPLAAEVGRRAADPGVPGAAMAEHLGTSLVSLLVAAALLTQLFVRRRLAMVCLLALMIVGAAGVDGLALGTWLRRADDAEQPLETRIAACIRAPSTFFYRRTAPRRLAAIAEAQDNPPALRQLAAELALAGRPNAHSDLDLTHAQSIGPASRLAAGLQAGKLTDPDTGRTVLLGIWPRTHLAVIAKRSGRRAPGDVRCLLPDEAERIVILTPGLTFRTVGTRDEFRRAVEAFDAGRLRESQVWRDVIAPAMADHGLQPVERD